MTDVYRLKPPEIPPPRKTDPSVAGRLDYPAALDENAEDVAKNYRRLLMPAASLVGCGLVGMVSRGDHAWLVVVPVALWMLPQMLTRYRLAVAVVLVGGIVVGRDVVHYLLPLIVAAHVARGFAMHYVWYATGAPMRLAVADRIRSSFDKTQKCRRTSPAIRQQAYHDAVTCWFGYNTAASDGPGVLTTPAGGIDRRVLQTCLAIIALCVLAGRPFLDMPELMAITARASGTHLSATADQIRAGRTANTLLVMICVFWVPPTILLAFFKSVYGEVVAAAYEARESALNSPPEERHSAILERLDAQETRNG